MRERSAQEQLSHAVNKPFLSLNTQTTASMDLFTTVTCCMLLYVVFLCCILLFISSDIPRLWSFTSLLIFTFLNSDFTLALYMASFKTHIDFLEWAEYMEYVTKRNFRGLAVLEFLGRSFFYFIFARPIFSAIYIAHYKYMHSHSTKRIISQTFYFLYEFPSPR